MNAKDRKMLRTITLVAISGVLMSIVLLWSWNTLADLFGGPVLEFRHAVALLLGLIGLRFALGSGMNRRGQQCRREIG